MKPYSKKLYNVWYSARRRCHNIKDKNYAEYGGRGITMCPAWRNDSNKFIDWAWDNGWKPGVVIDRINNNKGYCPSNCRFVNHQVSSANQRMSSRNTSGYKGISFHALKKKWIVVTSINRERTYCGCYKTKHEAAKALSLAATCNTPAEARALLAIRSAPGRRKDLCNY